MYVDLSAFPTISTRNAPLLSFRRRLPRWEASSARLTSKILAHHELCADPQTLASIASVVGSGSLDGGCADGLPQGEDRIASHDRYMDCYAERCCQWGAEGERAEAIGHLTEAHELRGVHMTGDHTTKPISCVVCNALVYGRRLQCHRCGHGGHSKHVSVRNNICTLVMLKSSEATDERPANNR